MAFHVELSQRARENLRTFPKRDQQIITDEIRDQLVHQPDQPTRQRKKLRDNDIAPWELRIGDIRIFYDIDKDENLVIIVAIGEKAHNILRTGGEEIDL